MKVIDTITRTSLSLAVIMILVITASAQDKLLLTEFVATPTGGEYIEIYNPGSSTVTLTNYYFTDATQGGGTTAYYQIVLGGTAGGSGVDNDFDFHVQFPAGATIDAGVYQTVSLAGSDAFNTEYGVDPTYELFEDGGAADAIPDMLEIHTGSVGSSAGFSSEEVAILYYWDGVTDLVTDIDYVVWGDKAEAVDKTGVAIDGPDGDTDATTYANDIAVADQATAPKHSFGFAAQRFDLTEGSEVQTGGNGVGGNDETSENLSLTWQSDSTATPNAAAQTVAGLQPLLISEFVATPTGGEYVEIYNPGTVVVDLTNFYFTDATQGGGTTAYYQIVLGGTAGGSGVDNDFDFHVRFPAGASINPGVYQTVSLAGSDAFNTEYGVDPTYELFEDGGAADAIPDMLEIHTGSVGSSAGFSSEEVAILYYWDGVTDLVTDIDYVVWGDKAEAVDKTGVAIDGPDGDTDATTYANDIAVADQATAPKHSFGFAAQRLDFSEGSEVQTGGNGFGGANETSENTDSTWHADSTATPNAAPQEIIIPMTAKLLLSEIVVTPTFGEMFEIYNPGTDSVDLTDYYVTDATSSSNSLYYYNIVLQNGTSGGASTTDFNARFPAGAFIQAGEYQTVAVDGAVNFKTTFGVDPTYELIATDAAIPDMLEAETGSIGASGGLSNSGEVVVLYYWDGTTDLVTDVDYVLWGDKNEGVDKTGISVDGPDADTDATAYNDEVAVADQDIAGPTDGSWLHDNDFSAQRIDLAEGIQVLGGGNGIQGADETSENTSATWYTLTSPTPNAEHNVDYIDLTIAEMEVDADGDFIPDRLGQMVRIRGVISTPNLQTSNTSHYLDDGTAGTDMFYFGLDSMFFPGDSVIVEGEMAFFAGVTEIIPANGAAVTVLGFDAAIRVQTVPVNTINDSVGEEYEGEIVLLDEPVRLADEAAWPNGASSIDLWITNGPDTVKMRLDSDIGMGGDPRPCGEFWLTGVVSQFAFNTPPNDNYSVIPRGFKDMVLLDAAVITSAVDMGGVAQISFTASPRDTSGAPDAITKYDVMAFFDDGTELLLGSITADNSATYSELLMDPAKEAYVVVFAISAGGCGLWSEAVHYEETVGVGDENIIPDAYDLSANYPNPFNPTTKINYKLKENTQVKIVVFNLLGEQVAILIDRELTAGSYVAEWNGLSERGKILSSGIYFYRMTAGDFTKTNKMILLK